MGNVLITGDLAHYRENFESNLVPMFNTDRAASLASIGRFKQIANNLEAKVIIQHDLRDVAKLSAFPAAARSEADDHADGSPDRAPQHVCRRALYIGRASDPTLMVPRVRAERHRVLRAHQRVDARESRNRHALSVRLR